MGTSDTEQGNKPKTSDLNCTDAVQSFALLGNTNVVSICMPVYPTEQVGKVAMIAIGKTVVPAGTDCTRMTAGRTKDFNVSGMDPVYKYISYINGGAASDAPLLEVTEGYR